MRAWSFEPLICERGMASTLYDGMIIAAAERAGCKRIWWENLNPGQTYFGIRVENPFR